MQQSIQQITYKTYKYAYVRAELTPMESTYHLYIIKVHDILGSRRQEENKNFYIVLQVSLNGITIIKDENINIQVIDVVNDEYHGLARIFDLKSKVVNTCRFNHGEGVD